MMGSSAPVVSPKGCSERRVSEYSMTVKAVVINLAVTPPRQQVNSRIHFHSRLLVCRHRDSD